MGHVKAVKDALNN